MATATTTTAKDAERIRQIGKKAGLDDNIITFAQTLYQQALDGGFSTAGDGRVYPAALYAACRVREEPVKPRTIADAADVPTDHVVSDFERLVDALPFDVDLEEPTAYVKDYLDRLDAPTDMRSEALEMVEEAVDEGLNSGKSASGFAAGIVYAASLITDAGYSQGEVADVANVGVVTVRNRYKDVMEIRDVPIPHSGPSSPNTAASVEEAIDTVFDDLEGVPDFVRDNAHELADKAEGTDWVEGKTPLGVAAGVIWYIANNNRIDVSQSELADAAGVHKETVHNRVKDIRKWKRRRELAEEKSYNELKRIAGEAGVDVGRTPSKEHLIDRIIEEEAFTGE